MAVPARVETLSTEELLEAIGELAAELNALERKVEPLRWRLAAALSAAMDRGMSAKGLADRVERTEGTVRQWVAVHRRYGEMAKDRPRFIDAAVMINSPGDAEALEAVAAVTGNTVISAHRNRLPEVRQVRELLSQPEVRKAVQADPATVEIIARDVVARSQELSGRVAHHQAADLRRKSAETAAKRSAEGLPPRGGKPTGMPAVLGAISVVMELRRSAAILAATLKRARELTVTDDWRADALACAEQVATVANEFKAYLLTGDPDSAEFDAALRALLDGGTR